jgi:hypothetical protein
LHNLGWNRKLQAATDFHHILCEYIVWMQKTSLKIPIMNI